MSLHLNDAKLLSAAATAVAAGNGLKEKFQMKKNAIDPTLMYGSLSTLSNLYLQSAAGNNHAAAVAAAAAAAAAAASSLNGNSSLETSPAFTNGNATSTKSGGNANITSSTVTNKKDAILKAFEGLARAASTKSVS
jgi:hypothetical protein